MSKCRHDNTKTVMLEINRHGDVYQRTFCGDISTTAGCSSILRRGDTDQYLGNADVSQSMWLRIGKRRFMVTVKEA